MARKVEWTERAWNDLEEIADYINKDSSFYAASMVGEIRGAARSLRNLAERGRMVPEFNDPDIRELIIRKTYRLIYKITPEKVYIIGCIHGARIMPLHPKDKES